jgi:hypothetical protein
MNQLNLKANSASYFNEVNQFADFAIPLAWPDTTARADERWFMVLRKLGILKNLNFKVGHAAIILVERRTGQALYYDFGRYVTPRGNGRPRSHQTDPKLTLRTICQFSDDPTTEHPITNIDALIAELEQNKAATHGDGILYFSVASDVSFLRARESADLMTLTGNVRYSAFAPGNNNCSRFVEKVLVASLLPGSDARWHVNYPETFVASPVSNVVNANRHHLIGICADGQISYQRMGRLDSLLYFIRQTSDNFRKRKAVLLPPDDRPGRMGQPADCPESIPCDAQWLGGIGEGGWHHLSASGHNTYILRKYDTHGDCEFQVEMSQTSPSGFNPNLPFRFVYDTHALCATLEQNDTKHHLEAVSLGDVPSSEAGLADAHSPQHHLMADENHVI